jgi:hypothetical protein
MRLQRVFHYTRTRQVIWIAEENWPALTAIRPASRGVRLSRGQPVAS